MHPTVTPRVITRFEPWMALSFSDGSIGPDFERVNLNQLEAFYSLRATAYDSYLPSLAEQIPALLRAWDFRWGATSIPTSLAVYWGEEVGRRTDGEAMLQALSAASDKLARLRHLEDAVGRHQSLPASHRRHRPAVQRRGPEHPGRLHLVALGLARVIRRAHAHRHGKMANDGEQLCGGGRNHTDRAERGGNGEQRGGDPVAAFQRSGCAGIARAIQNVQRAERGRYRAAAFDPGR